MNAPSDSAASSDVAPFAQRAAPRAPAVLVLLKLVASFAVLAASSAALCAQAAATGSVAGRVENSSAGTYLEHARIRVAGTRLETFTDPSGQYRIDGVPAGTATVNVFYTGFTPRQAQVTVAAGAVARQDFSLASAEVSATAGAAEVVKLPEYVVATERETDAKAIAINEQRFAPGIEDVVSTDAYGNINQGNIGEFVKHIPGVNIEFKDGNNPSGIDIRGFGTNYTRMTVDGNMVASAAIANTQTPNRQFVLEGASINNYSRIEVYKEPLPNMPANTMGGGVNLVSKSAFEYAKPQVNFETYLSGNSYSFDLGKIGGVYRSKRREIVPSVDGSVVLPISDKLGVVVTAADYDQYYTTMQSSPNRTFSLKNSSLVSVSNPYTQSLTFSEAPNEVDSANASIKIDWKPSEGNLLSITGMATAYRQESAHRTIGYNAGGTQPVSWGETFTHGAVGAASAPGFGGGWQNRDALTRFIGANYTFDRGPWKADLAATYSNSNNRVRDIDKGFFTSVSTSASAVKTINFDGIDNGTASVGHITALDASGNPVDTTKLANYNLTQVGSQPATNNDSVTEFRGDLTRDFETPWFPVSVSIGGDTNNLVRDLKYNSISWTYLGQNGSASMAGMEDPNIGGTSPRYGLPGYEWPSPWVVYDLFKSHPEYFTETDSQQGSSIKNIATRSPLLFERVSAGYAMLDAKFFHDRLRLVGGVRYELTQDRGYGFKQNSNAPYQIGADGKPLLDSKGKPIYLPQYVGTASGGLAQSEAIYQYRGTYNARNYHGYYKDAAGTFTITDNLVARLAYAETMGRPSPSDIVPTLSISDNSTYDPSLGGYPGYINASNTSLVPWTAKNYDFELEYYLPHNGLASVGVFRKDIKKFFYTLYEPADQALLDSIGLSSDYLGYRYQTRLNGGDARIDGVEFSYSQELDFVPIVGRYLTLTGNLTKFAVTGYNASNFDLKSGGGNIPLTGNAGLNFGYKRFAADIEWNYRGEEFRDTANNYPGADENVRAVTQWDADVEYRLTNHLSLFAAGRNLNNGVTRWSLDGPVAPQWAHLETYYTNGRQFSFGVRGAF